MTAPLWSEISVFGEGQMSRQPKQMAWRAGPSGWPWFAIGLGCEGNKRHRVFVVLCICECCEHQERLSVAAKMERWSHVRPARPAGAFSLRGTLSICHRGRNMSDNSGGLSDIQLYYSFFSFFPNNLSLIVGDIRPENSKKESLRQHLQITSLVQQSKSRRNSIYD